MLQANLHTLLRIITQKMSNPNPCTENLALGRGKKPKLAHQSYKINLSAKDKDILEVIAEAYECIYGGKGSISALLTKIARQELLITPQIPYLTTLKTVTIIQEQKDSIDEKNYGSQNRCGINLFRLLMGQTNALENTGWFTTKEILHPRPSGIRSAEEQCLTGSTKAYKKLPISIQGEGLILYFFSRQKENDLEKIDIDMETTFILFSENHQCFPPGIIKMFLLDEQGNEVYYPESQELIKKESNTNPDVILTINHGKDKFFIKIVVGDKILLEAFDCN